MSTDDKSAQFYKLRANEYAAHVRNPKESVYHAYYEKPAMYALLPNLEGKIVLSIGCGSGEDSVYLKRQGAAKSVGIDMSDEMIGIARNSYPECEFHIMNMEAIDFPGNSFDFVYSSLAIHYVENWSNVFTHVYRILKPNSSFLFSCGHPLRFAMDDTGNDEFFARTLQIKEKTDTREVTITGDYFAKRKTIDALGKNTANTWTMPIGDIATMATDAGFLIERLVDPRPLEELKEIDPQTYYRLSKIPEFMIFKLRKM
ncbi:MAG: methyltransferase domain-containing protein [Mucilaginibacter sp.]